MRQAFGFSFIAMFLHFQFQPRIFPPARCLVQHTSVIVTILQTILTLNRIIYCCSYYFLGSRDSTGEIDMKGTYKKLPSDRHGKFFSFVENVQLICQEICFSSKISHGTPGLSVSSLFITNKPLLCDYISKIEHRWNELDYTRHEITFFLYRG